MARHLPQRVRRKVGDRHPIVIVAAIIAAVRQQFGDHGADLAAAYEQDVFHAASLARKPANASPAPFTRRLAAKPLRRRHDGQDSYRHRRLGLRSLARDLLSRRVSPRRSSSSISARGSTRPRSTPPITARMSPATFAKWAGERAGRLQLRAEGVALLHQPQESGRGRRIDRQVLRAGLHRARRQARPDPLAAGADQEVRRRRDPRLPDAAADQPRRHRAAPRARSPARKLQVPRVRRSGPRLQCRDRLRRPSDLSGDRRSHRRFRLCPAAADRGGRARRLCAGGARPLGGGGRGLGGGREPGGARLCQRRRGAEDAARNLRLLHQRRQGPQSRRRRGADGKARNDVSNPSRRSTAPSLGQVETADAAAVAAAVGPRARGVPRLARGAAAAAGRAGAAVRRGAARGEGRARPAGQPRMRQDPLGRPRRGPGDDRHLRLRGRPFPPALRPHHRHRAAGPPDDGDLAPARRGRGDLGVQLPGRGLGLECLPRLRLRRQRRLEAVREDAALRRARWPNCSPARPSGSATRRRGCSRSCRAAARRARRWPTIRACRWSRRPARPGWAGRWGRAWRRASGAACSSSAATMR